MPRPVRSQTFATKTGTRFNRVTVQHWLTDLVFRTLIWLTKRLPYKMRVQLMGQIVSGGIARVAGYRKRAERNLALVFPQMPKPEIRKLAKAACGNAGRTIIENYSLNDLAQVVRQGDITGDGMTALRAALDVGRPVIFATGHFGNYEALRILLKDQGIKIGALYRPMKNPFFNAHYVEAMQSVSGPMFAQGRNGTRGFVKHLRAGGPLVLLYDIYSTSSPEIPFMGQPTRTPQSIGELALKFDALVLPYFCIRNADGITFQTELEAPVEGDSPEAIMIELNRRLERKVYAHPEQWFWIHRRWKNILGVPAN